MATAVWYIWLPHCCIANKPLNHMWTPKLHLCVDLHQNLTNPSRNLYTRVNLPFRSLLLSTIIHPIHFIFGGCVAGDYIKCSANIEVAQQSSSSILAKNGSPLAKFPFFWQLSAPLCLGARTHVSGCLSAARQTMEKTYHLLDSCSVWCPGNPHNTSPNPETHHLSNQTHIPEKLSPFMLYKESLLEAITPESSQRTCCQYTGKVDKLFHALCVLLWTLYIPLVDGIGPVCNSQTATLALPATISVQHVCMLVFVKPLTDIIHSRWLPLIIYHPPGSISISPALCARFMCFVFIISNILKCLMAVSL